MSETEKEMTPGTAKGWCRLQRVSCYHSAQLHRSSAHYLHAGFHRVRGRFGSIGVPECIRENCEILGRGDEAEIKNRLWWYCVYYPDVVNGSA